MASLIDFPWEQFTVTSTGAPLANPAKVSNATGIHATSAMRIRFSLVRAEFFDYSDRTYSVQNCTFCKAKNRAAVITIRPRNSHADVRFCTLLRPPFGMQEFLSAGSRF